MTLPVKAEPTVPQKKSMEDHNLSQIEKVIIQGDLTPLTPDQRVTYYHTVCKSMGLNPYTMPFGYLNLNGKLTLYTKKDATDQLRAVKGISIVGLDGSAVDDLYVVKAKATCPDGRIDQATGAVSIVGLRGEAKANAMMKAETKAKRRVTLSISGLGWVDDSEIETIPNAIKVNVDISTGEILDPIPTVTYQPQKEILKPIETLDEPVKPKSNSQLDTPLDGLNVFMLEMKGVHGENIVKFVAHSAENMKYTEIKVWNYAFLNQDAFIKQFEKWSKN